MLIREVVQCDRCHHYRPANEGDCDCGTLPASEERLPRPDLQQAPGRTRSREGLRVA